MTYFVEKGSLNLQTLIYQGFQAFLPPEIHHPYTNRKINE